MFVCSQDWVVPPKPVLRPAVEGKLRVGQQVVEMEGDGRASLVCDQCAAGEGIGEKKERVRVLISKRQGGLLLHYWEGTSKAGSMEVEISLSGERGYVETVSVPVVPF